MENLYHSLELGLLCPVYLFYGDEPLLMEQATERVAKLVVPEDSPWCRENFTGDDCDIPALVEDANSSGFFGAKKLIVVRNVLWFKTGKKTAAVEVDGEAEEENAGKLDLEPLYAYLADPNPDTVLILLAVGKVAKNSRALKLSQAAGRAVEFAAPKGAQREQWLREHFHAAGKQAPAEVCQYLSLMCGEGLSVLRSEADKLLLYVGRKNALTLADAEAIVSRSALAGVFELTDSVAAGQAAQAGETLRRLLRQGEPSPRILSLLANQYRTMLAVQSMAAQGFSTADMGSQLAVNPFFAKKCLAQSRRYTPRQLLRALDILLVADRDGKTGRCDIDRSLELAVLRICAL